MKKIISLIIIILFIILSIDSTKANTVDTMISVVFEADFPPYQFEEYGKFTGLHIDILNTMAKKNNFIIEYIPKKNSNECFEALDNGEADIYLGAISGNEDYIEQYTEDISQSSIVMIANNKIANKIKNNNNVGSISASLENNIIKYSYINKLRNLRYTVVPNQIKAFDLLISKDVDVLIGVKDSILYLLDEYKIKNDYTVVNNFMVAIEYNIIVKRGDKQLLSLLNNELQKLKINGEYEKIYDKWIYNETFKLQTLLNIVVIITFIILAIYILTFLFNRRLKNILKEQIDEKTKELKIINNDLQKQIIETRNSNELKNCIVEHSISAIFAIDTDYKITLFSKSACNITNIHNLNIGYDAFDIPLLETILKSILNKLFVEDIKIINEELTIKDEENNSKSYRYDIYQLYNFDNSIRGAIITIEDITEELKIKDQIFEREKNKALNQIIAGIAHEIRNPLTSIKAFIQLIPAKIDNQKFQNQLTEIVPKEVDRVNNLIKDLIDYAKPETNNKNIIDLSEIINSCIFLIKPTLNKKKIELILSEEKNLQLYVDKNQIKQILINIILNGLESMAEKISKFNITNNLQININTFSKGDNVCITIVDEGMGMTEEQIKKSFEPFYTSKSYGTGLGLSLSKQFVEENNGTLTIESEPLLFTKVTIKFRRVS